MPAAPECAGRVLRLLQDWFPGGPETAMQATLSEKTTELFKNGATFASGKVGQAFSLDGVDDHVIIPHNASLNPVSITVEHGSRQRIPAEYQIIIDKGHGSGPWLGLGGADQT